MISQVNPHPANARPAMRTRITQVGARLIARGITLYFVRQNLIGIHESSGKALGIMVFTTAVVGLVLAWSGVTMAVRGPMNSIPTRPDLSKKVQYEVVTGTDRMTGEEREIWKRD